MPKFGRRSDFDETDYRNTSALIVSNAPYGTAKTPRVRVKIVGGKYVSVVENGGDDSGSIALPAVSPRSLHVDSPRTASSVSKQSDGLSIFSAQSGNSKNSTRHASSLHPLDQKSRFGQTPHQKKMQLMNYTSAHMDMYGSHNHSPRDVDKNQQLNPHTVLPPIKRTETTQSGRAPTSGAVDNGRTPALYGHLPTGRNLPRDAVQLSKEDTLALMSSVKKDLAGFDYKNLKDVYLGLTEKFDPKFSGYIKYGHLESYLDKCQVSVAPKSLRLIASMYIHEEENEWVNYEHVLSFIGAALKEPKGKASKQNRQQDKRIPEPEQKMNRKEPSPDSVQRYSKNRSPRTWQRNVPYAEILPPKLTDQQLPPRQKPASPITAPFQTDTNKQGYSNQQNISSKIVKRTSPSKDHKEVELLRSLENKILTMPNFDLQKLWADFCQADKAYRQTLSPAQIKKLCYKHKLMLPESDVHSILERCEEREGQYNWVQFAEFLERIQPAHTGLPIPDSKRPTEYVKHYPQPSSNWPNMEGEDTETPMNEPMEETPNNPTKVSKDESGSVDPNALLPVHDPRLDELDNLKHKLDRQQVLDELEEQLQKMEHQYEETKQQLLTGKKTAENLPWFQRFMKLGEALYKNDVQNTGKIPSEEVKWLVNEYNDIYNLNLSDDDISECLQSTVDNGGIIIDSLLKALHKRGS